VQFVTIAANRVRMVLSAQLVTQLLHLEYIAPPLRSVLALPNITTMEQIKYVRPVYILAQPALPRQEIV